MRERLKKKKNSKSMVPVTAPGQALSGALLQEKEGPGGGKVRTAHKTGFRIQGKKSQNRGRSEAFLRGGTAKKRIKGATSGGEKEKRGGTPAIPEQKAQRPGSLERWVGKMLGESLNREGRTRIP